MAVELVCPSERLAGLLGLVARALASPAFARRTSTAPSGEARIAERGNRAIRSSERRPSSAPTSIGPSLRPSARRHGLFPRRGDARRIARYWSERFSAERLSIVVVADVERRALAGSSRVSPLGAIPRRSGPAAAKLGVRLPIRPWFKAVAVSGMPGSAMLRGEFGAPRGFLARLPRAEP